MIVKSQTFTKVGFLVRNFYHLYLITDNTGFDTVISALGRSAIQLQIPLIKVAESSSTIKRFFASEYGTDIEYFPNSNTEKPHQQKLKVRAYIRDNVKRLEYTYVVTGPYPEMFFAANRNKPELGSFDVLAKKAWLLGTGKEKVSFTTMPDVGKLVVAALKHPDASRNATLKVNSFTATADEILAEFEKQTGSKWEVNYTSLDDLKKLEKEAWETGAPYATGATLRRIWTEGGTLYEKRDNEKIGLKDEDMGTLAEVVAGTIKNQTEGTEKFY